jgi:hypothetical protein
MPVKGDSIFRAGAEAKGSHSCRLKQVIEHIHAPRKPSETKVRALLDLRSSNTTGNRVIYVSPDPTGHDRGIHKHQLIHAFAMGATEESQSTLLSTSPHGVGLYSHITTA